MTTNQEVLSEIEREAAATGLLLDRLPPDRLAWRPHPKSMSLGQLALHVATIPAFYGKAIASGAAEAGDLLKHPECTSIDEIRRAWSDNLASARELLGGETGADSNWSLSRDGSDLLTLPKSLARRIFMLSHWYHHRGQLTVYLRLLEVPLPATYGPSADESPF